jgi:protein phosphatase
MANAASEKSAQSAASDGAASRTIPLRSAMRSHPGRIRRENQDACAAAPELGIYLVCDGMGGAAAGEIASHIATETFLHSIGQSASLPAEPQPQNSMTADHPQRRLEQAVRAANLAVYQRAQKYRALRGMGTTLVATLVHRTHTGCTAWIAHVGDSRCYLLRANNLRQLTTDHSLVEEQIQAGLLSRQEAEFSPVRNVITRAVGTQPTVPADILAHPLQSGDVLLLASDGLIRELPDAEISRFLANHDTDLDAACAALIAAANAHGGRDNITVLLIAAD